MKRIILIISVFFVAMACQEIPDESMPFKFMLYEDESVLLDLNPYMTSRQINFAISQSWEISSDSWITISENELSGYGGNNTITLYFENNLTGSDRVGYVNITSEGGTKQLKVSQKPLESEYFEIGPEGGRIAVPVEIDEDRKYLYDYYDKEWLRHDRQEMFVSENNSYDERVGRLGLRYDDRGKETYVFYVKQKGLDIPPYLKIGKVTYTDWDGESKPVNVEGETIGLYVYGGISYYNVPLRMDGDTWALDEKILFDEVDKVYAYFPYKNTNNDYIDFSSIFGFWYNEGKLNEKEQSVDLNLENLMAKVKFKFTVSDDYPNETLILRRYRLNIPTRGIINPIEESDVQVTGYDVTSSYNGNEGWTLKKGYTYSTSGNETIPTTEKREIKMVVYIDDTSFEAILPDTADYWKAGNIYEYEIVCTADGLRIGDVVVNEWDNNDSGDITIYN